MCTPTAFRTALATLLAAPLAVAQTPAAVATAYADFAHTVYADARASAERLREALHAFADAPSPDTLEAARARWRTARERYGETEVLRFYNGPIDDPRSGPETLLNAWPVDEAYIDVVRGSDRGGLLQNTEDYPNLTATVLQLANERGGEANICVGWHAIEFMLWGQDFDADGPGDRPHTDFVDGGSPHAARRRAYLRVLGDLLVEHLLQLERAWQPERDNYRRSFCRDADRAVRHMLTGIVVLTGFELGGERMAVAYETRDQENEHSCFSDTSHADFVHDQRGIVRAFRETGLRELTAATEPKLTAAADAALDRTTAAIDAIPRPFDRAVLGADDAPGRVAVAAALDRLSEQADLFAALALALGHDIPIRPVGR